MTQSLTLAERRERLREAIELARSHAEQRQGFEWATMGNMMKELSHDVETLESDETSRDDSGAHDAVETRLQTLLAELEASHDNGPNS